MEGLSKEITVVCRNLVNVGARPGSRWCSVGISASSAQQQASIFFNQPSINRQSNSAGTVNQILCYFDANHGMLCMRVTQSVNCHPSTLLVPRPTRHMSHRSAVNICCRRTKGYCHATCHYNPGPFVCNNPLVACFSQGCRATKTGGGLENTVGAATRSIPSFPPRRVPATRAR